MAEYAKLTTSGQIINMPNPYNVTISNPTDEQKAWIAQQFGWILKETTTPPEYDSATQYLTSEWKVQDGRIVQVWTINQIPVVEETPTVEEEVVDTPTETVEEEPTV